MFQHYIREPDRWISAGNNRIAVFHDHGRVNLDAATVDSFGEEWSRFNQFETKDISRAGDQYFDIVTDEMANGETVALDVGCGTGRWSAYLAHRVKCIEATDPSDSILPASHYLSEYKNVRLTRASLDNLPFADESFDFVYSLGVLHHVPDTRSAIATVARKLKPSGYLLLYLYYRFENRGPIFKMLFYLSHLLRLVISRLPYAGKKIICEVIAAVVYFPMARFAGIIRTLGFTQLSARLPLSYYSDKSYYIMRNDALDRFGTPLEHRFTRQEITDMLEAAGMTEIKFSGNMPYWHLTARKK